MSPEPYYEVVEDRPDPGRPLAVRLAISWLTNALVLAVVAGLLSGVTVKNFGSLLAAAAVFGVLNTVLKPLLRFITLPLAILTLGIAWFFVSMLMLVITKGIVGRIPHPRVLDTGGGHADRVGGQHGAGLHPGSVAGHR